MIINKIAELRKKECITQGMLAARLNISRQTIISLEDNKNNISLELAFKISKYFNKPIDEIWEEKDMEKVLNDKATTITEIQQKYGKNTILINKRTVFRCSTNELEWGPVSLLNYELPKYGKMKKFVVVDNSAYELIPTREYKSRTDKVRHVIGKKVDIDPSCIDFNKLTWQDKKKKK